MFMQVFACQMLKIKYIPNITGLGTPVENPGPLQALTTRLYKMGVAGASCIFFQETVFTDVKRNYGYAAAAGYDFDLVWV